MPLEVPNVLENHEWRPVLLENLHYFVKQSSARPVSTPVLVPRFGERLTGESSTQNVMLRDLLLEVPDVAVYDCVGLTEILLVQLPELVIDLGHEHTLVSKAA